MYYIASNIAFGPCGEIICGTNDEPDRIFGVFERYEDVLEIEKFIDNLWMEAVNGYQKTLEEFLLLARPVVIKSLPEDLQNLKEIFGIVTNIYFDEAGEIICNYGGYLTSYFDDIKETNYDDSPARIIAFFPRREDAQVVVNYINKLWLEKIERLSVESGQTIFNAKTDAQITIQKLSELPAWAMQ